MDRQRCVEGIGERTSLILKYYKHQDFADVFDGGITYIETDNGCEVRRVTVIKDRYYSSNVDLHLGEGYVDYDSPENADVVPITKQEFDQIWDQHLEAYRDQWNQAKKNYPVGSSVVGYIERFFPQGVIIYFDDHTLGVADHEQCRASTKPEFIMSTQIKITGVVIGYDEVNQWIMVGSPQVHEEGVS